MMMGTETTRTQTRVREVMKTPMLNAESSMPNAQGSSASLGIEHWALGLGHCYRGFSHCTGSTDLPSIRISKYKAGDPAGAWPTRPTSAPLSTLSPCLTLTEER